MRLDSAEDGLGEVGRGRWGVALDDAREARFLEGLALVVLGLRDAVAVQNEGVARSDGRFERFVLRELEHAERDAAAREPLERAVGAPQERRHVPGVDVDHPARSRVARGEEQRDEPGRGRVPSHLDVQAVGQCGRLEPLVDQRAEHRQQQRHQQRRRAALSRHVPERDDDAAVRQWEDVVEIAADGVGGTGQAKRLEGRRVVLRLRQHRVLDLAGDLEVVLERQPVRHLEEHEEVDEEEADEQAGRTRGPARQRQADIEDERAEEERNLAAADSPEQLKESDQAEHEADAVNDAPGGRQAQRERPEEQSHPLQPALVARESREGGFVEGLGEETVGLARVAGEQALEVLALQPVGIRVEKRTRTVGKTRFGGTHGCRGPINLDDENRSRPVPGPPRGPVRGGRKMPAFQT